MVASSRRVLLLTLLVSLCVVSTPLATPWSQVQDLPVNGETLIRHVRQALGRGAVARARTLATQTVAPAEVTRVATALVDLFEGAVPAAVAALSPAAEAGHPDALVELGLLELQQGRRDAGRSRLDGLLRQGVDMTPENTFRMARAAAALNDVRLANSLFQRVGPLPLQQADMETTWGDMLLEKHQAGEAVRSYRAAIEADPAWVRAYLGLSRALSDEDPAGAKAALEQAQTLAARHPDVLLLIAEQKLAADDRDATRAALDSLAQVRPGSYDELALRAALRYAMGDIAAADTMVAEAVGRNGSFVQGYLALGQQAARAYRFADAAAYVRKAVQMEADNAQAHADLGLYLMRTGDEREAREELERAFKLDPYNTVTYNLLTLLDTMDAFVEVESGPFIFKFPKDQVDVLRPYALPLADEAYKTFSARYGFTPQGPILVEIFAKHDDFAVRTMGLPGLVGALGACFGRVIAMNSPGTMRDSNVSPFSWHATLWHEIAHVFSLQASNYKVPRWLTEGISVFEEHLKNPAWGRELALEYARAMAQKRTFGVKGLPNAFTRPQDLALAYFEASLLTEHLVSASGDAGMRALLAAYAAGAKDEEAFGKAFGKTVDQVEASFQVFVNDRYGELARAMAEQPGGAGRGAPPSVDTLKAAVAKSPGSFMAQWSLGNALYQAGDLAGARQALEAAAALAPMAQGNNSPRALLAAIAEKQGDNARARDELVRLLQWDHANVGAARQLTQLARGLQDVRTEELALRVIADVDPLDAAAHGALGKRALERKEFALALPELLAALALGPANLAEAHADIAEAYLGLGRRDDARKAALRSLEQAPTYARAQDLLLAAMGGK